MNGLTTYSLKIELVDNYINLFDKKKELKETYQQQISKMERKDTSFTNFSPIYFLKEEVFFKCLDWRNRNQKYQTQSFRTEQ